MDSPPLSEIILEALHHMTRPTMTSHLAALSPDFCTPKRSGIPPSVQKALLSFSNENNLFLNPALLTTESARPKEEGLLESAIVSFTKAMSTALQAGPSAQPPVSTVAHDRDMLRFGRMYGAIPAPSCSRGPDCSVNRVRLCPPGGRCLQVYLTPAEHEACLEDNSKVNSIGEGLCLLCVRSCAAALTEFYDSTISNVDQIPRQVGLPLPCSNLVDVAGGYNSATFGRCTPIQVSPAIASHSIVAPCFDLLRCVYDPHSETWRVDQSAIEFNPTCRPNGQRTRAASTSH